MSRKLFYVPLECYAERYTMQWSAAETGWLERRWKEAGVPYHRVEPRTLPTGGAIKTGVAVDAVGRSTYCFEQVSMLLHLIQAGTITDEDVIFFDDFWTPGLEAIPYLCDQMGVHPKMFAFCHAQSVDEFDFTHRMRKWMRPIEQGFGQFLTGIFVNSDVLEELLLLGGIGNRDKVSVTGHVFASDEVMERMPAAYRKIMTGDVARGEMVEWPRRRNNVVFSSRWDLEKNPEFFLEVAKQCILVKGEHAAENPVTFTVCTSAKKLRSNSPRLLHSLRLALARFNGRLILKEGLTKEEYYHELATSKVQLNTADQDFVSITLLESSVAGCYPLYPYFRSFPQALRHDMQFLYQHKDVGHAVRMVRRLLGSTDEVKLLWSPEAIRSRQWIHERHNFTWKRQLNIMGFEAYAPLAGQAERQPYWPALD